MKFPQITPFLVAMVFSIIALIYFFIGLKESEGLTLFYAIYSFLGFFIFLTLDWVIKLIFKQKVLFIWLTELILIAFGILFFDYLVPL